MAKPVTKPVEKPVSKAATKAAAKSVSKTVSKIAAGIAGEDLVGRQRSDQGRRQGSRAEDNPHLLSPPVQPAAPEVPIVRHKYQVGETVYLRRRIPAAPLLPAPIR